MIRGCRFVQAGQHYWGIRPVSMPTHVRIEKAATPYAAAQLAFGRGTDSFQYKDFGTRVSVIQNDKKRIALIQNKEGWITFGNPSSSLLIDR